MLHHTLMGGALALTIASLAPAQAGTLAAPLRANPVVQNVACAVGAHLGPLGACVIGAEDPPPVIIERRAADAPPPDVATEKSVTHDANGCTTRTIQQTDGMGNSEARSKSNCD